MSKMRIARKEELAGSRSDCGQGGPDDATECEICEVKGEPETPQQESIIESTRKEILSSDAGFPLANHAERLKDTN